MKVAHHQDFLLLGLSNVLCVVGWKEPDTICGNAFPVKEAYFPVKEVPRKPCGILVAFACRQKALEKACFLAGEKSSLGFKQPLTIPSIWDVVTWVPSGDRAFSAVSKEMQSNSLRSGRRSAFWIMNLVSFGKTDLRVKVLTFTEVGGCTIKGNDSFVISTNENRIQLFITHLPPDNPTDPERI
ncbi:hypothetical protein llap_5427 [Limosa lapponica baueri]|uniref:Uncharacterized protein n=1 Tax=Limosa lapponica baueri TaxID=1758121 RepID=A0A2I0UDY7_LIMLA|nr:hypothetical protein llap_5427 [Limosa lapponica baueri]